MNSFECKLNHKADAKIEQTKLSEVGEPLGNVSGLSQTTVLTTST